METSRKELEEALKGTDVGEIKKSMESLQEVLKEIGASVYKGGEAQGAGPSGAEGGSVGAPGQEGTGDGNTVNTDYKVDK